MGHSELIIVYCKRKADSDMSKSSQIKLILIANGRYY